MNKENILAEIISFIEKGDKTIESIDSFILEAKQKYGGQGNKELFERALDVEKEYREYLADVYTATKGYGLKKIEESTFKPKYIEEIRGGESEIKGYINVLSTNTIFESVKQLIISVQEKLRAEAEKINMRSENPFKIILDDEKLFSIKIKKNKLSFEKSTLQYWLIKYMVDNYDENNIYYHHLAIKYLKNNKPDWGGKISGVIQNINDANNDRENKVIEPDKKR